MFIKRGPDRLRRICQDVVAGVDTKRFVAFSSKETAERAGGGVGGRLETDGAAREPREMNAAHSQGDKLEDDTSHSATKGGEHLTGTPRWESDEIKAGNLVHARRRRRGLWSPDTQDLDNIPLLVELAEPGDPTFFYIQDLKV